MTYKENITAILECHFGGFKQEIIDNACNCILELEPCEENAISKEQAMAIIYNIKENYRSDRENHPINYGTLCDINLQLVNLPPITPTHKIGHWIMLDECANSGYYCSECRKKVIKEGWSGTIKKIKYCPNCGTKMV